MNQIQRWPIANSDDAAVPVAGIPTTNKVKTSDLLKNESSQRLMPLTPGERRYLQQYITKTKQPFDTNSMEEVFTFRRWLSEQLGTGW